MRTGAIPDRAVVGLCYSGDISYQVAGKLIDIVTVIGYTRLLRTYPEQVCVVHIHTLYADVVLQGAVVVDVTWLDALSFIVVDVGANQSAAVSTYPDVAAAVSCHAVDAMVNRNAAQPQMVANAGIPGIGILVVDHQRSLAVEPNVVHLVCKDLERLALTQVLLGYQIGLPYGLLLAHNVTAYQLSVFVDENGSVAALADRADVSLWNAMCVVGVGKLKTGLLLHVVGDNAFVGNGGPEILVAVNKYHVGLSFYAHAGIDLLHVAFKTLRLGMVDTEACRCLYPQVSVKHLLDADDVTVGQRRTILRVALEILEGVAVKAVQTGRSSEPHIATLVFQDAVDLAADKSVTCVKCLEQVNACCCHR